MKKNGDFWVTQPIHSGASINKDCVVRGNYPLHTGHLSFPTPPNWMIDKFEN